MQKYRIEKVLGDGAFGTVFKAVNIKTNEVVAIKKMKQKYSSWDECLELREIKSLRKIDHPNIAKMKEVLLVKQQLHLVFEYLDSNLYEEYSRRKQSGNPFSQAQIKNISYQIAQALAHMHKNGFFHRDLKPENLLMSGPIVKICDFGLARQIRSRPPFTDYVSTRWYRAPELLLRSTNYNSPVDVFAFGCILAQLYNLSPLFPGNNDMDQLTRVVKVLGTPDQSEWSEGYKSAKSLNYTFPNEIGISLYKLIPTASNEAIDLLQCCFKYSSRKRSTMLELLKHEYFKGISSPTQECVAPKKKNIVFAEKQDGQILDMKHQQQKINAFRQTKQKFRQTRRHEAFASDPLKQLEKGHHRQENNHKNEEEEDIDAIIKQLEEKKKRKTPKQFKISKVLSKPLSKYHTEVQKNKYHEPHLYSYKPPLRTEHSDLPSIHSTPQRQISRQISKEVSVKPPSKKSSIFSYGFQPASLPSLTPAIHHHEKQYTPFANRLHKLPNSIENSSKSHNIKPHNINSIMPMVLPYHF